MLEGHQRVDALPMCRTSFRSLIFGIDIYECFVLSVIVDQLVGI